MLDWLREITAAFLTAERLALGLRVVAVLAIGVGTVCVLDSVLRFLRNYLLEVAGKKCDVIMSPIMSVSPRMWPAKMQISTFGLTAWRNSTPS